MRPPIYSTSPYQSQRCQEELIYGRRTADVSTYHACHRRSVPERSLLQARKPGIDCLQPFDILTVSLVSTSTQNCTFHGGVLRLSINNFNSVFNSYPSATITAYCILLHCILTSYFIVTYFCPAVKVENQRWGNCISALGQNGPPTCDCGLFLWNLRCGNAGSQ